MAIADSEPGASLSAAASSSSDVISSDAFNSIDPLLATDLPNGKKRVDAYNFRQPRIFSHDQIRLLNYVHDAFARSLSVFLSDRLRTIVEVAVDTIEQQSYSDYVSSCQTPTGLFIVEEEKLGQKAIFEIDPRFVLFTLEKALGGTNESEATTRPLSRIEQRYISKTLALMMEELSIAWGEIAVMHFRETGFESNAEFIQIIPGSEPVLVSRFRLIAYAKEYYFNVCYPYLMLRQILGRTGIKQWLSRSRRDLDEDIRDQFTHHLGETPVNLRVELGQATLSLSDVKNLQVGDIIPLHKDANDTIDVLIGDRPFCTGRIGKVGKRLAVGVSHVVKTNEHE